MRQAIKGLTWERLVAEVEALGLEPYRAGQLAAWVHARAADDFAAMSDLPAAVRRTLAERFHLTPHRIVAEQVSPRDGTRKLLLQFPDGAAVETVVMPREGHDTACVSSQVGCRFACKFCVTARRGLLRQLTPDEIVAQVQVARRLGSRPGLNIVFMGMGEPLDNLDHVLEALRILTDPRLGGIGVRRITVSTTGVVEGIHALAASGLRVRLAVSLNASNDVDRRRLMPVSGRRSIAAILDAAAAYAQRTRHHVTLEYVLLADVTDRDEDLAALRALGDPRGPFKLNLIPFNPDPRLRFEPPSARRVRAFEEGLRGAFRSVSVRWSQGRDIDAACGQLFGQANASAS